MQRICREYAGNVPVPWCLFFDVGGTFRGYGRQFREDLVIMREMYQRHGAYFLDLGKRNS
jgi:hypothetical protein